MNGIECHLENTEQEENREELNPTTLSPKRARIADQTQSTTFHTPASRRMLFAPAIDGTQSSLEASPAVTVCIIIL